MKKIYFLFTILFLLIIYSITYAQWVQTSGPGNGSVMALSKSDSIIYAGTANLSSSGVFISTNNGQNWSQCFNKHIYSLASYGQYVFAGVFNEYDSATYRSTNYGQTWSQSLSMDAFGFLTYTSGGIPYIFLGKNSICLSTNNGVNWVGKSTWCSYVDAFARSSTHIYEGTVYLGCGVTMSTINGDSCVGIGLNGHDVFSVAVNNSYLFAGTGNGVYVTSNNGVNWVQTPLNDQTVYSLTLNYSNIFAGTSNGVYLSTNNGSSWGQKNEGLGNQGIRTLLIKSNYLFAGAGNGYVYKRQIAPNTPILTSPPNGAIGLSLTPVLKWSDNSFAISYRVQLGTDSVINNIILDTNVGYFPSNDSLLVPPGRLNYNMTYYWHVNATDTGTSDWSSTWHFTSGMLGISKISDKIPTQYALYQNYPNPFNPTTKIRFSLPTPVQGKAQRISLFLYDVRGRVVATLIYDQLKPGSYEVEWDASNYPSGVYFYRLNTGDYTETRKMILIK